MSWMYPKVTDYWDENARAIDTGARRLAENVDAADACQEIREAVSRHFDALPPAMLPQLCAVVADDLYRAACSTDRWDGDLGAYLEASAGTFFSKAADRGLMLQYLVDNQWEDMSRPLQLFGDWFSSAGLVYVCPQAIAQQLPDGDAQESRDVAAQLVQRCQAERLHFFQLDADVADDSFTAAFAGRDLAGTATAFRNQAPEPGTTFSFWAGETD